MVRKVGTSTGNPERGPVIINVQARPVCKPRLLSPSPAETSRQRLQLTQGYTSCGAGHTFKPRIPQTSLWCSGRVVCRVHHSLERVTVPDFDGPQPFCSIPEANYFFALFFSWIQAAPFILCHPRHPSLGIILILIVTLLPNVTMMPSAMLHRHAAPESNSNVAS
jgi:hypothetical protein